MSETNILSAHQLSYMRQDQCILENISFELHAGEILLIAGPNGSGKSSLLKLIAGLATPTQGKLTWKNKPLSNEYTEQLHYLGHTNGIKLNLTVAENLHLINKLALANHANIDAALEWLQLTPYKNTLVKYLSAGQQRRVALTKLFLLPKAIWILDEPFTALDTQSQQTLSEKLKMHLQTNGIAIVSSHHALNMVTTKTVRLTPC